MHISNTSLWCYHELNKKGGMEGGKKTINKWQADKGT